MLDRGRTLTGLALLALLWVVTAIRTVPLVEAGLADRLAATLVPERVLRGAVSMSGRDATLHGSAFQAGDRESLLSEARSAPGIRHVGDAFASLPPADPAPVWSLRRDGSVLILSGQVPDQLTRRAVLAALREAAPGLTVADHLAFAAGAPVDWAGRAAFAARLLAFLDNGRASLSASRLDLSGLTANLADYERILAGLDSLPEGLQPGQRAIDPPIVSPFLWSARREGERLLLDGHAPPGLAASISEAARASGPWRAIEDRTKPASGAPADFKKAARAALVLLARLDEGRVQLSGQGVSVSGRAPQGLSPADVAAAVPAGFSLVALDLSASPAPSLFRASRSEKGLALSGHVADAAMQEAVADHVRRHFPGETLSLDLKAQAGASSSYRDGVMTALAALSRLGAGEVEVTGDSIRVKGEALTASARAALESLAAPSGYGLALAVRIEPVGLPLTPPECQAALLGPLERGRILFDIARAAVASESLGLLDRLAATLQRCPEARVEIAGHTDSAGADEFNLALSQRRAEAVAAILVQAGVDAERVSARGYGARNPLAPNDTNENRAKNRRIEFLLK